MTATKQITMKDIEACIQLAFDAAVEFKRGDDPDEFRILHIEPLQNALRQGVAAGLRCNEGRLKQKFAALEKQLKRIEKFTRL